MKLLLLLILSAPFFAAGQDAIVASIQEDSIEYELMDFPDVEAKFPGGAAEMRKYIFNSLNFPDSLVVNSEVGENGGGTFRVNFIVDSNGKIRNVKMVTSSYPELESILLDLLNDMPDWIPAQYLGNNVATRVRLPIMIHLE